MERRYIIVASAIVLAGLLVAASLPPRTGSSTGTKTTAMNETSVSTIIQTERCSTLGGVYPSLPELPPVDALVIATGQFNATVTGYSGSRQVFSQCYVGANTAEIIPWTALDMQNWTSVRITAQKMEANNSNLTLSMHGVINSTVAPFGFVSIFPTLYPSSR